MLKMVMIMIKALFRIPLLVMLCFLLVYAPEICSSVSAPYSLAMPERTLLRVALHGDSDASKQIQKAIDTYQKAHPSVHMRITALSNQQLTPPYPDVIVSAAPHFAHLPPSFTSAACGTAVRVYTSEEGSPAVHEFALYIVEALSAYGAHSEI